jgi:hypothetical protein
MVTAHGQRPSLESQALQSFCDGNVGLSFIPPTTDAEGDVHRHRRRSRSSLESDLPNLELAAIPPLDGHAISE